MALLTVSSAITLSNKPQIRNTMGLRLHKALGYGLTGLSINPDSPCQSNDPRINFASSVFTHAEKNADAVEAYMKYLRKRTQNAMDNFEDTDGISLMFTLRLLEQQVEEADGNYNKVDLWGHVFYEGEYGDPGTILIVPPGLGSQWSHYDDKLDAVEASLNGNHSLSPEVKAVPFSPYPFDGWMDTRTGEKISFEVESKMGVINLLTRSLEDGNLPEDKRENIAQGLERIQAKFAETVGTDTYEEADKVIVPLVPPEVKDFAEWSGVFPDGETWKELRPMIYSYWA
jgi:hypothetical protein